MSLVEMLTAVAANTVTIDNVVTAMVLAEGGVADAARELKHQVTQEDVYPFNTPATRWMSHLDHTLSRTGPRTAVLGALHERLVRCLRNTAALIRRIETGWPRRSPADAQRDHARRQVEQVVRSRVRAECDEWPERLNRELDELLWDPEIEALLEAGSVEEVVERLKSELAEIKAELDVLTPGEGDATGETRTRPARPRTRRAPGEPPPHGFQPGKTRPPFEWRGSG